MRTIPALAASALLLLAAPAGAQEGAAKASMVGKDGKSMGVATLEQTKSGLLHIMVELTGVPPGAHGFHVHAVGKCDSADGFKSAGGHFKLDGQMHGAMNEKGPHAGDLPNVHVGQDGILKAEFFSDSMSLTAGKPGNLRDADGSSIMLHGMADDYMTDPAGDSGDRIACGVIQ